MEELKELKGGEVRKQAHQQRRHRCLRQERVTGFYYGRVHFEATVILKSTDVYDVDSFGLIT
jgi:hypothetical protein